MVGYTTAMKRKDEVRNTLKELRKRGYLLSLGSSSKNAKSYKLTDYELTSFSDLLTIAV